MKIAFTDEQSLRLAEIGLALDYVEFEGDEKESVDGDTCEVVFMDAEDGRKFVSIEPMVNPDDDTTVDPDCVHVEYFTRDENEEADFVSAECITMDNLQAELSAWFSTKKETTQ